jgi:hypothetical protein
MSRESCFSNVTVGAKLVRFSSEPASRRNESAKGKTFDPNHPPRL